MDRAIKGLAHEGRVSIVAVETTELIEQIRKIHDLTPTTTAVLGRIATISGMMGFTELKDEEDSITIQMNGRGPVGAIVSIVTRKNDKSIIKCYLQNPHVELPLESNGKIAVGKAVGTDGFLNVIRETDITKKSYSGLVPIVSGEIAEDFAEYFARSKQTPTVLALGVLVNKDGVLRSGGYMINLMPDATEEDIQILEESVANCDSISKMLENDMSLEEIVRKVTADENALFLIDDLKVEWNCDCSKERFAEGLASIGKKDLRQIIDEDEKIETKCQFCNKKYYFEKDELEDIHKKLKDQKNN